MSDGRSLLEGRYAIIGYGSLIWDLDDLAPHVTLPWAMGEGPPLPMEFSRISAKRKLALVAVLDDENGSPCRTHAIASVRATIDEASEDLQAREQAADPSQIGALCLDTGFRRTNSHHTSSDGVADLVESWCESVGALGAVWADLPRNFYDHTGEPFSVEAALAYLQILQGDSLDEAVRYINKAPQETDTPLRRLLARDPWWADVSRQLC